MHPETYAVRLTGKIWTIDSWDSETFKVEIKDEHDNVIAEQTYTGNNNNPGQDARRLQCSGTEGGWHDGYTSIHLEADYTPENGDLTILVTNTLDEQVNNEAIGYGDMKFEYFYNQLPPFSVSTTNNYDQIEENPTGLWSNNCEATEKTCEGHTYWGGHNECAQSHTFWRVF
jgi:hypothetical protein